MKFAYFGYRGWAEEILRELEEFDYEIDTYTIEDSEYSGELFRGKEIQKIDPKNLDPNLLKEYDAIFFYGWSWMVPQEIVDSIPCVCLHPSPLPLYRGGSPFQNQIMDGEDKSAVSLFKMGKGLDDGPIYYQRDFSLLGDFSEVLERVVQVGSELTKELLRDFRDGTVVETPQDESQATTYKRKKPGNSELTVEKLGAMTARQIHDHIRALQDPYPNAYIIGSDGNKVYITKSKLEEP
jgi:methionyl-tRNA formyltransferase|tara:strand:+ start:10547 stop:11260 length:714 start_codon:yes stop_codon:yes gene_type:complete